MSLILEDILWSFANILSDIVFETGKIMWRSVIVRVSIAVK